MRLKSFAAATMKDAMQMVRDDLGADAVIVATRHSRANGGTVRITAAVEQPATQAPQWQAQWQAQGQAQRQAQGQAQRQETNGAATAKEPATMASQVIARALRRHGTPAGIIERLATAARVLSVADPVLALAAALDDGFRFAPLPEHGGDRPIMLIGPPGAGKTVSLAKLAARVTGADKPVTLITTDTVRTGGVEQLAALARVIDTDLQTAGEPAALAAIIGTCRPGAAILIDSAGTNPFSPTDMARLNGLVRAAGAEPVLVLSAGGDAADSAETAAAFANIGTSRLLVTRLDAARRLGGLLAAADAGRLRFCNVSVTADVAGGLNSINPVSLARLLMPRAAPRQRRPAVAEAVT